jgi:hypothetical protein
MFERLTLTLNLVLFRVSTVRNSTIAGTSRWPKANSQHGVHAVALIEWVGIFLSSPIFTDLKIRRVALFTPALKQN